MLKKIYLIFLYIFALIGLIFVGVFFAIRLKITNVSGKVDNLSNAFQENVQNQILGVSSSSNPDLDIKELTQLRDIKVKNLCSLKELGYISPKNVRKILAVRKTNNSDYIFSQMIFALETHLVDKDSYDKNVTNCMNNFANKSFYEVDIENLIKETDSKNLLEWPDREEWKAVVESIKKEKNIIDKAANVANIEPRIIVSNLMVEQLRIFYSQREMYKKYFEPLKILANSNKISLGVMAIKEDTAISVENHLKDKNSPYYLGTEYEHLLDYQNDQNIGQQRYDRLVGNSHYYSYLYGALYLKQMMKQWHDAGYDISSRPEIIGTLFNVGFSQSKPNANPKVGGSTVTINQIEYSFGRLAYEFYFSGEMVDEFPYVSMIN